MPKVQMPKGEFVKEHKHLVKVLRSGSKGAQRKEASEQASELSPPKLTDMVKK